MAFQVEPDCAPPFPQFGAFNRPPVLIIATLLLAGCEKPFEPLSRGEFAFSLYGPLDSAADTQWVRVMPIRESVEAPAGPFEAVVMLE